MTDQEIAAQRDQDLETFTSKPRWGCLQWLVVTLLAIIAIGISIPAFNGVATKAPLMQSGNNARQISMALKSYAGDNNGKYPQGATANEAFRELFRAGLLDDEDAFTSPASPYVPDGNIGTAPDFKEAVEAGENHWAMTKGLADESNGNAPLLFENPSVPSWPPYWNARLAGAAKPGRAWKSGKIVIARNDGSVNAENLTDTHSEHATVAPIKDGKNLFDLAGPHEVLDVEK